MKNLVLTAIKTNPLRYPGLEALLTWQLSSGECVGVQLVGVHQPHQSFSSTSLILIIGEKLPLDGEVRDEHWNTTEEDMCRAAFGI